MQVSAARLPEHAAHSATLAHLMSTWFVHAVHMGHCLSSRPVVGVRAVIACSLGYVSLYAVVSAVHLLAEGIAGGSLHYFPLGEPLPLLGTLAALPTHHTAATVTSTPLEQRVGDAVYSVEQLAALLLQTPTHIASTEPISPVQPAQAASQAPTQMQAPTTVSPQDRQHVQQPLPHTGGGSAPASVHIDRATAAAELAMLAGSTGASTQQSMDGGLEGSTGAKAGTGPVTDFDRWMRQVRQGAHTAARVAARHHLYM